MAKLKKSKDEDIVIDADKELVFQDEESLFSHFSKDIEEIEEHYFNWKKDTDISEADYPAREGRLNETLEDPDEIWKDNLNILGKGATVYIKVFYEDEDADEESDVHEYYVAACYITGNVPSFVYLHFPSNDLDLVEHFREGELVYSKALSDAPAGAVEGDALSEGDDFAIGLYEAMLVVRSGADILEDDFSQYSELREEAVEEADEIWRRDDSMGNVLVTFVKDFSDEVEEGLYYIVVTVEDTPSNSHALLFSFPTKDKTLVDRYRLGENLQAEEVVQESSH